MRNVVLADRLANDGGLSGAVIVAFADGETFHTAKEVRAGTIGYPARVGNRPDQLPGNWIFVEIGAWIS